MTIKPRDAKTNEHYVAMLEKAADSYAKRSSGGLEQGRRQAQQAAEFRLKGTRGAKRRKLKSVIAKLSEIDRGSSPTEAAFAMERLQELQLELTSLGSGWRPSDLPRKPRKQRGGRPRKVEVTMPEVRKSRRARILGDL